jgi:hypothetical protein
MVVLLLLACAHRGPVRAETGDTSADSGADAADTGAPLGAPCGPWAGVARVGTQWTYVASDAYVETFGFDGTFTVEVIAIDDPATTVTLQQTGAYRGDSGAFTWSRTDTWRCDAAGAWWVRSESETSSISHGTPIDTRGWRTFEPGWLVRPTEMADWSDAFTVTQPVNGGDPVVTSAECVTTVTDATTFTVEGQTVAARRVTPTCTGVGADAMWLGAGVGLIDNGDEQLVGFLP